MNMSLGLTTWDWITYPVACPWMFLPLEAAIDCLWLFLIAVGPCDNFRVLACPLVLSTLQPCVGDSFPAVSRWHRLLEDSWYFDFYSLPPLLQCSLSLKCGSCIVDYQSGLGPQGTSCLYFD